MAIVPRTLGPGVASGQNLPDTWNVTTGENSAGRPRFPGLRTRAPSLGRPHFCDVGDQQSPNPASSPVSTARAPPPRIGRQRWVVIALDRQTGRPLWQRTAYEGVPREKRHIKSTYANATPATDGNTVVAFFGSQGCTRSTSTESCCGRRTWAPGCRCLRSAGVRWGTASSPIIYKNSSSFSAIRRRSHSCSPSTSPTGRDRVEDAEGGAAVMGYADRLCVGAGETRNS